MHLHKILSSAQAVSLPRFTLRQFLHAAPVPRPEMTCMHLLPFHNLKSKDVCPDSGMLNPETDKSSTFVLRIMNSKTILSHCLAAAAHNCLAGFSYPCLCLCFGFSQIIRILPFLLITLHFSHIGLTDDLTFTANPPFSTPRGHRTIEQPDLLPMPR